MDSGGVKVDVRDKYSMLFPLEEDSNDDDEDEVPESLEEGGGGR